MNTTKFSFAFHSYKTMWTISNYCNTITQLFVCQDIKTHYLNQDVHHRFSSPASPSTSEQRLFCPQILPNFQHTSQVENDSNVEKKIVSNHISAIDQKDIVCNSSHLTMSPVSVCISTHVCNYYNSLSFNVWITDRFTLWKLHVHVLDLFAKSICWFWFLMCAEEPVSNGPT